MSNKKRSQLNNVRPVALLGFSGANQAMLEYCFSSVVDCELVTPSSAKILIVNGEQPLSDEDIQAQAVKYTADYKIVISIRDIEWEGFHLLKKPHSSQDLLELVRAYQIEDVKAEAFERHSDHKVNPKDVDFYRGGVYSRKRQGEALKQKLIKGNLVVNAADRLVQRIETDIREQEERLQAELEAEKARHEAIVAKKKAKKLAEYKRKKLEEKKQKLLEEKKQKLVAEKKKKIAAAKAKKLQELRIEKARIKQQEDEKLRSEQLPDERDASKQVNLTEEQVLQCCGNAADVNLSRSDERRTVFLNPEGTLLIKMTEAVELATKLEQPVEITGLPGQLYIFPSQKVFYSTFSDDFLNQLALTRFGFGELDLEPKGGEFLLEDKEKHLAEAVESLVWKVAVWTARGKLFNGMDPERSIQLSVKPDFDQLIALPKCNEIADIWNGRSMSALDVASFLDIPQRVVFSFMSGAYSLGWFQE